MLRNRAQWVRASRTGDPLHLRKRVIGCAGIATGADIGRDVVNAGVQFVTLKPEAAIVHSAASFALIRGA